MPRMHPFNDIFDACLMDSGLSLKELEKRTGINYKRFQRWKEADGTKPRYRDELIRTADAMRCNGPQTNAMLQAANHGSLENVQADDLDEMTREAIADIRDRTRPEVEASFDLDVFMDDYYVKNEKRGAERKARKKRKKEQAETALTKGQHPPLEGEIVAASQGEIRPASEDEILIVITTFHHNHNDQEGHFKILRGIKDVKKRLGLENLRIEHDPTVLRADQKEEAECIGQQYDADMIIWGEDLEVNITVNYLNLKVHNFPVVDTRVEADPMSVSRIDFLAYIDFITRKAPAAFTFLCFCAIGHSYYGKGDYGIARTAIIMAIDALDTEFGLIDGGVAYAYFILGNVHLNSDSPDLQQAVEYFNRAIAFDPNDVSAHHNRGVAYYEQQNFEQALADYTKAIEINPDRGSFAYCNRGGVYRGLGEFEKAIADYTTAIKLSPIDDLSCDAYYNRGNVYRGLGEFERAIADYTAAIKINSDFILPYCFRADTYRKLGKFEKAIADYTRSIELNPTGDPAYYAAVCHDRGNAYRDLGNFEQAIADFVAAIVLDPNKADAYIDRGVTYAYQGEFEKAIADYTTAIKINSGFALSYRNRGIVCYKQGKFEQALADFKEALSVDLKCSQTSALKFPESDRQMIEQLIKELESKQ